ncbi:hypothetical protein GCM10009001_20160 [Virgibacillus siamensis]|uniref:Uncharacterized protein n=1 Tax=Virgibacillus siamensis TaxID=480071 RepID=A0ABN1G3C3_9BACI
MKKLNKLPIIATILVSLFLFQTTTVLAGGNRAEDSEITFQTDSNGVTFAINLTVVSTAEVTYPGKILKRETLYASTKDACFLPFSSNITTDVIKYYRGGDDLRTTHRPTQPYNAIHDPCMDVDANEAYPYSNLSASYDYTSLSTAVWTSWQTIPGAYQVDVKENQPID